MQGDAQIPRAPRWVPKITCSLRFHTLPSLSLLLRIQEYSHMWFCKFCGPFKRFTFIMCVCVCLCVGMCTLVQVIAEAKKKKSNSPNYKQLWAAQCWCWEQNSGSLQKQHVLLAVSPAHSACSSEMVNQALLSLPQCRVTKDQWSFMTRSKSQAAHQRWLPDLEYMGYLLPQPNQVLLSYPVVHPKPQ